MQRSDEESKTQRPTVEASWRGEDDALGHEAEEEASLAGTTEEIGVLGHAQPRVKATNRAEDVGSHCTQLGGYPESLFGPGAQEEESSVEWIVGISNHAQANCCLSLVEVGKYRCYHAWSEVRVGIEEEENIPACLSCTAVASSAHARLPLLEDTESELWMLLGKGTYATARVIG